MPQLKLAWWFFNFLLGWLSLLMLITMMSNKSLLSYKMSSPMTTTHSTNQKEWSWN